MGQSNYNTPDRDSAVEHHINPIYLYAYASTLNATTMTLADTWYSFESVIDGSVASNVTKTGDATFVLGKADIVEIEWKASGASDVNALITIGLAKNATFTSGVIDDSSDVLDGSFDAARADTVGSAAGEIGVHSLWGGSSEVDDTYTPVIMSSVAGAVFTPDSACGTVQTLN